LWPSTRDDPLTAVRVFYCIYVFPEISEIGVSPFFFRVVKGAPEFESPSAKRRGDEGFSFATPFSLFFITKQVEGLLPDRNNALGLPPESERTKAPVFQTF